MKQQSFLVPTLDDLLAESIEVLRVNEPKDGHYMGAFSGGKDSVVVKEVTRLAGVKAEWHYHNTTIDPPELVRFIKCAHPDVIWDKPKYGNFFNRLVSKGFPTRVNRWCCEEYKEGSVPRGSTVILGVRAAESKRRAARWKHVTFHNRSKRWAVAPILRWSDEDVWDFIRGRQLPYCSLYDEGFKRLGCIGCPMAGESGRRREFARWPGYARAWRRAFQRLWDRRVSEQPKQVDGKQWVGVSRFRSCQEMWEWWLSSKPLPAPLVNEDGEECQLQLDMMSGGSDEDV